MKEVLKRWVEEQKSVEIIRNDDCSQSIQGKLIFVDEKTIQIKGEYRLKMIIPWTKVAVIRDKSGEVRNSDELIKLPLVKIYYNGPQRTITHGFLEKMDDDGVITVYHDGVTSLHPMSAIQRIVFICENGGLDI